MEGREGVGRDGWRLAGWWLGLSALSRRRLFQPASRRPPRAPVASLGSSRPGAARFFQPPARPVPRPPPPLSPSFFPPQKHALHALLPRHGLSLRRRPRLLRLQGSVGDHPSFFPSPSLGSLARLAWGTTTGDLFGRALYSAYSLAGALSVSIAGRSTAADPLRVSRIARGGRISSERSLRGGTVLVGATRLTLRAFHVLLLQWPRSLARPSSFPRLGPTRSFPPAPASPALLLPSPPWPVLVCTPSSSIGRRSSSKRSPLFVSSQLPAAPTLEPTPVPSPTSTLVPLA